MKPQLRARDHQRISHVVPGVSHIYQFQSFQLSEVLPNRQHIRQHLCGVIFIGQSVPHRNTCVFCQFLHDLLTKSPVFNTIVHPAQNSRSILDALLLSHLGSCRTQVCSSHTHVMGRHLERAACTGTVLFKKQSYILSPVMIHRDSLFLLFFDFSRQIQKIGDLLRRKIFQRQKISSF